MPSTRTRQTTTHRTPVHPHRQASAGAFAKRHYQALAAVLARELARVRRTAPDATPADTVRAVAEALADELARDNRRFDRSRFLAACDLH